MPNVAIAQLDIKNACLISIVRVRLDRRCPKAVAVRSANRTSQDQGIEPENPFAA
jgi:hypothetical protein